MRDFESLVYSHSFMVVYPVVVAALLSVILLGQGPGEGQRGGVGGHQRMDVEQAAQGQAGQ